MSTQKIYKPKKSLEDLVNLLEKYKFLFNKINIERIIDTFELRWSLTGIEIDGKQLDDVIKFVRELRSYFYVTQSTYSEVIDNKFYGSICISRLWLPIHLIRCARNRDIICFP